MKKGMALGVAFLAVFVFVGIAKASSFTSTLSLGTGKSLFGATRAYTAGNNGINIRVDSFTKVAGITYTKLKTTYQTDNGNSSTLVGTTTFMITSTGNQAKQWGNLPNGNRYYHFTTAIDGFNYGGVKSNKVVMSS